MADYFTTLCKTDEHGFCMFLIERPADDFSLDTKPIKVSYSAAAGTAYVIMDEVVVPPENLVGTPGQGFYQTMGNFNIERWQMGAFCALVCSAWPGIQLLCERIPACNSAIDSLIHMLHPNVCQATDNHYLNNHPVSV